MGTETERKFLVKDDSWKAHVSNTFEIMQGYLPVSAFTFRAQGEKGSATIARGGLPAFEYALPAKEAQDLSERAPSEARIRLRGKEAFLTFKRDTPKPEERDECECRIDPAQARELLATRCIGAPVSKTRHEVEYHGKTFEVDVFKGANAGLMTAEVELFYADESFARPAWLGAEVTGDPNYRNAALSVRPYSAWPRPGVASLAP